MPTIVFSVLIFIIIIFTGSIGGYVNYLTMALSPPDTPAAEMLTKKALLLQILLGIVGAGLVPLLLHLTSSTLLTSADTGVLRFFIFAGYCLIGSIFSQALLNSLAKRLDLEKVQKEVKEQRKELNQTKEKLTEAEARANEAESKAIEAEKYILDALKQEEDSDETATKIETRSEFIMASVNDDAQTGYTTYDMKHLLEYMQHSKFRDHSLSGISKKSKIPQEKVEAIIVAFLHSEIVFPVTWYGRTFYQLTPKGRDTLIVE